MSKDQTPTTPETQTPLKEDISMALVAAFNAGYDVGRSDGAKYRIDHGGDAPARATRRHLGSVNRALKREAFGTRHPFISVRR